MRLRLSALVLAALVSSHAALAQGKFPPDSLTNVRVFPKTMPIPQFIGAMRNFTFALGVRCQHCHLGEEGQPLTTFNFTSDEKRTKVVARQMMQMVAEVNRRLDSIPGKVGVGPAVTCATCHRGITRPVPLGQLIAEVAIASGGDSATRAYRALRQRYFGRDAYDFSEASLNTAGFRTAQGKKPDEALALLKLNEEFYPVATSTAVTRGNVLLMKGDTGAAAASFREALRRDSTNFEARTRLQNIGQKP